MRTDAELLVAARGDAGAFRELYDRYAERVFGFHLNRSRDPHAAHDLTAETFAQVWISRDRFRDEMQGTARPWVFAITRHVLVASVRRRALEQVACERLGILAELDRDPAVEPDDSWLDGVDEALADLPPSQRDAIRLRVVEDLAYDDVAAELDTSPEAARVRVHRGLNTLRDRVTNRSDDITETTG